MLNETAKISTQDKAPQLDSRRKTETYSRYNKLREFADWLYIKADRVPRQDFEVNPKKYLGELKTRIKEVIESVPDDRLKLTWASSPSPQDIKKMVFDYLGLEGNDPVTFERLNMERSGSRNRSIFFQALRRCRGYLMRNNIPKSIELDSKSPTLENNPADNDIEELLS